jgi:hypothetical protein
MEPVEKYGFGSRMVLGGDGGMGQQQGSMEAKFPSS